MPRHFFLFGCVLLFAWFSGGARAGSLVLTPMADTMISDDPTHPPFNGGTTTIACGTTRQGQHTRSLMRFEISGLPTNATLTNVTLRLVVNQAPGGGAVAPFSLHRLLVPWDELAANWTNSGLADWSQLGAAAGVDFRAEPSATTTIDGSGAYLFSDPVLFNEVLSWTTNGANGATNLGWMLKCHTEEVLQSAKRFTAREYSDPAQTPHLILDYTAPLTIALTHPRVEDGQFSFDFTAQPGVDYHAEYKDDLSGEWLLYDNYPDPGVETVITIHDEFVAQRFFRVLSP